MKCPHCGKQTKLNGQIESVPISGPAGLAKEVVIILTCIKCDAVLGAVNMPGS
jgi:hypothetical protein